MKLFRKKKKEKHTQTHLGEEEKKQRECANGKMRSGAVIQTHLTRFFFLFLLLLLVVVVVVVSIGLCALSVLFFLQFNAVYFSFMKSRSSEKMYKNKPIERNNQRNERRSNLRQ